MRPPRGRREAAETREQRAERYAVLGVDEEGNGVMSDPVMELLEAYAAEPSSVPSQNRVIVIDQLGPSR